MWLQAAAAAIGALHLEDIEEQRGLFDGEEAVSEGERDAHGARLSEHAAAGCMPTAHVRASPYAWCRVYRSCVSRVLRCPCHPCVHAILCPCHPCVHVIPVSMPSLCPCHSIAYVMPCGACVQGAWRERERVRVRERERDERTMRRERGERARTGMASSSQLQAQAQQQRQDGKRPGGAREA